MYGFGFMIAVGELGSFYRNSLIALLVPL
jgi:hypothetical protein